MHVLLTLTLPSPHHGESTTRGGGFWDKHLVFMSFFMLASLGLIRPLEIKSPGFLFALNNLALIGV